MAIYIFSTIFLLGLISFFLTWLLIKYSIKKKILGHPNERSLHDLPTPRIGGIAIVICWYAGVILLFWYGIIEKSLFYALLCGIIIAAVSLIDDLKGIRPIIRLIIHFVASIIAFWFLDGLRPLVLPEIRFNYDYITYPLSILGMVWFINLFNFMDGVDGFASVEAIFISCVLFILSWNIVNILLIVCIGGFFCWNWPKAKIFMGDVGSTQLGFILVVLGIYFHNTYEFSILNWIMLTSPFWFDATLTLLRRWRNGENLSVAHRKHAYQRLVQAGNSHEKVNLYLIILNIFIVFLIIFYRSFKLLQIPIFIFTLFLFYFLVNRIDRKVPFANDKY
jgi:Fuc2NAc and GlcNAc transferase